MKTTIQLTIILLLIFAMGCENASDPEKIITSDCATKPGTHNFSWQIDTIGAWPSQFGGVWAFSDSDAYAMGNLMDPKDRETTLGLHWDGKTWSKQLSGTPMEIGHYSEAVTGDDNVMVSVGDTGPGFAPVPRLGEFNNVTKKWKSFQFSDNGTLFSVWTDKKEFFIAGGSNGLLYSKNSYSSGWVKIKTPYTGTAFGILGYKKSELYIEVNKEVNFSHEVELWRFKNEIWTKLYDTVSPDSSLIKIPDLVQPYGGFHMYHCENNNTVRLYFCTNPIYSYDLDSQTGKFSLATAPFSSGIGHLANQVREFDPNDIWFYGPRWYHWDGKTIKQIVLPGYENFTYGKSFIKTKTGKVFLPMIDDGSSQIFIIAQGKPIY